MSVSPQPGDRKVWDDDAVEFAELPFQTEWSQGYPAVVEALGQLKHIRILDFGCGSGKFARDLASRGASVTGVDPSPKMIALARISNGGELEFIKGDWRTLASMPEASFDAAVTCWVLCTIPTTAELKHIGQAIGRLLRPNGRLVVIENNPFAFGTPFDSFLVERPEDFAPTTPREVRVRLADGKGKSLAVTDHYWPTELLESTLSAKSGLHFERPRFTSEAIPHLIHVHARWGKLGAFRVLTFKKRPRS